MFKRSFLFFLVFVFSASFLSGCSTNPATGQNQFTALMSPQQEVQVGAQEHEKIMKQHGEYKDAKLQSYVRDVGAKISRNTERPDVRYQFFLLDSPMVNAFALPGGYVYLTRGLLALANSEAEMAAVLAHEVGHITGRHSAERYSRGVVTSLGAMILSSAIGKQGVSEALGLGTNLYMSSYSRGQESQADGLGIRYLLHSGYDAQAMAGFLSQLQASTALEGKLAGKATNTGADFFSTHPNTGQRVQEASVIAQGAPKGGSVGRDEYLWMLDGLVYGDSPAQGFVRGNQFIHPDMGFKFSVPQGYKIANQPSQVIAQGASGAIFVFDLVGNDKGLSAYNYLRDVVFAGKPEAGGVERTSVNGMNAATAGVQGQLNGQARQIRIMLIEWKQGQFARFQIALPQGLSAAEMDAIKASSYSFARLSAAEKGAVKPYRIKIVVARAGDSVSSIASRMPFSDYKEDRFRVLNGMNARDEVVAGRLYKTVIE